MGLGVEKFCLHQDVSHLEAIMIRNAGSKDALREIGLQMEKGEIQTFTDNNSPEKYFIVEQIQTKDCLYLKSDESMMLKVNNKIQKFIPFVMIQPKNLTAEYGLLLASELSKGALSNVNQSISSHDIVEYSKDDKATIIYVVCPPDRNELCTLTIKHRGQWYKENGKVFEMKVLARSRRERGDQNKSQRLRKDGDTPQGIYHLWGTLYTQDFKFGAQPRIDIDGMQPPLAFKHVHSANLLRIIPKEAFIDYWLHEFSLAFALGRYLLRIHDNSVDPQFPDTYTTPQTQQIFRASAGCINTGNQMKKLLQILQSFDVVSKKQTSTKNFYGRLDSPNLQNSFLVVIDQS
ncbi:MAG: hypothetical protein KDD46_08355 [Bdellovibrionales bacterium]|nr:hypothetical protein [Bdellovibrionales bacterium]